MRNFKFKEYFKQKLKGSASKAVLISLILHLIFLFFHIEQKSREVAKDASKTKRIKLVLKDRKGRRLKKGQHKKKKKAKKRQVVQNEKTGQKQKTDTRFLGETDQSFDKQSVARKVGIFKEAGKGKKDGSDQVGGKKKKVITKKKSRKVKKKKLSLSDLKMANLNPTDFNKFKNGITQAKGIKNGAQDKTGLARTNDYVDDVPLGDVTNLNTIEFKYYGFYNRIRKKLEQHWGNSLREKAKYLYRRGRTISSEVKITSLKVTLDYKGNIVRVKLKSASGIKELDEAAMESFNRAGPFPNPPKGMMKNGEATIEWGFVVKG
ncbi:MAG: hypothetical protein DRQ88_12610 [Epsilonproteobacteria bacterium]|nr:MAG: hypothetical protein DRQ89_12865 [Campylobacterota bacterium]RLA63280.1 MAG: hypothetical protein DRQ88_12610 [Campylobacterota bacterium]